MDRTTSKNINKENLPQEIPVFQLSINHGKNIQNGEYAYFVYLENEFTTNKMSDPDIQILSNTTSLQATATKDEKIITAVFFDTNSELTTNRGKIKVSEPSIILVEEHETFWSIAITDPTMNSELTSIDLYSTIDFNNKLEGALEEWEKFTIQLPKDEESGKPTILKINNSDSIQYKKNFDNQSLLTITSNGFTVSEDAFVRIFTLTGQTIKTINAHAGQFISIRKKGIYILKATNVTKSITVQAIF